MKQVTIQMFERKVHPMINQELRKYYNNFYDIKKRKKYQRRIILMEVKEYNRKYNAAVILCDMLCNNT